MQNSSHCLMSEVFFALCKELDTPFTLSAWLRFKYDPKSLLEFDIPVGDYLEKDTRRFAGDYCVFSALSKWKGLNTEVDLEAVALGKFAQTEMVCKETNKRLRSERLRPTNGQMSARLFLAKQKIAKLLGPFSLHCISPFFGWGPGATYDIKRASAQVDNKMSAIPLTVGGRAKELLQSVIQQDLHWSCTLLGQYPEGEWCFMPSVFKSTDSCRVETVPKNAKTNRVIAIEPTGNLFLQKGVGGYFRRRLKRVRIDLDNQAVNQQLAAVAANTDLATLDLKAASDTVSTELVYELFPLDWAIFMDSIRSHSAVMPDGSNVKLEKFSSMGNGFTFELESIIFWALGSVVSDEHSKEGVFSVYGDDIICQKAAASDVIDTLAFVGFETNEEKSFTSGLFYESCGKHYFGGQNVTPFYQKETFRDLPELIRFHNRIVRWGERCDFETKSHMPILRYSPAELKHCRLPFGEEGDDGFLCSIDDYLLSTRGFNKNFGWRTRVVRSPTRSLPGIEMALLANDLRQREKDVCVPPYGGIASSLPVSGEEPLSSFWTHGNVEVSYYGRKPITESSIRYGWRWIIPAGYCPLPR